MSNHEHIETGVGSVVSPEYPAELRRITLVNHGDATGAQLWALAQRVREGVHARFGVMLEPEPRIIGATA